MNTRKLAHLEVLKFLVYRNAYNSKWSKVSKVLKCLLGLQFHCLFLFKTLGDVMIRYFINRCPRKQKTEFCSAGQPL